MSLLIQETGHTYESMKRHLTEILDGIARKYPGIKKGIFIANDSLANVLVNLLVRKHGCFPEDFFLVGFDNSSISEEAVVPISTVGQQVDQLAYKAVELLVEQMNERKKRRPKPLKEPIHKVVTPILFRRETTEK